MARISKVAKVTTYLIEQISDMAAMEEKASKTKDYLNAALYSDFVKKLTIALSLVDDTKKEGKNG